MILPAQEIYNACILNPCAYRTRFNGVTYGISATGYDLRIDQDILLWPGRFVLASTVEHFTMPNNVLGVVHDKSTWLD